MRYALNAPIEGAGEIATMMFVWLVMFGISAAAYENLHPRIDVLVNVLPNKLKIIIESAIVMLMVVLLVDFMVRGWDYAWTSGIQKRVGMFDFSYIYVYMALPVGFCLMLIRILYHFFQDMKQIFRKPNAG